VGKGVVTTPRKNSYDITPTGLKKKKDQKSQRNKQKNKRPKKKTQKRIQLKGAFGINARMAGQSVGGGTAKLVYRL